VDDAEAEAKNADVLQMPDSRPTAKQLASLLNETDRTAAGLDSSMGGRTFILSCSEIEEQATSKTSEGFLADGTAWTDKAMDRARADGSRHDAEGQGKLWVGLDQCIAVEGAVLR
jgi:hypothetical protein